MDDKTDYFSFIFLFLGVSLILWVSLFSAPGVSEGFPSELGFVIGSSLAMLALSSIVFSAKKFQFKGMIFFWYSLLFLSCASYRLFEINKKSQQLMNFKQEAIVFSNNYTEHSEYEPHSEISSVTMGEFSPLMEYLRDIKQVSNEEEKLTDSLLKKYKMEDCFKLENFQDKESIQELILMLNKFRVDLKEARALIDKKIHLIETSLKQKYKFSLQGFNQEFTKSMALRRKSESIGYLTIDTLIDMLSFLLDKNDDYVVFNNKIYFEKNTDLETYNEFMTKLYLIAEQEEKHNNVCIERRKQAAQRLRNICSKEV